MTPGRYLLDTTVLIDVSRRRPSVATWLRELLRGTDDVLVCAVSVAEFFAGIRPEERQEWQDFVAELWHCDVTKDIAILAGNLRYDLAWQGRSIHLPDALIAATALAYGAVLVTADVRDFAATGITTRVMPS